jgi:23S rRNA pseudouridine1911/1915/1917 synthase
VNALLYHLDDLSGIGGRLRPGIVHRLDQDTSGVLVVAKDDVAHEGLAQQFAAHSVERRYVALAAQLRGPGLASEGRIDTLFGRHRSDRKRFSGKVARGRRAITHFRVTDRFGDGAMRVECWLETGRTHQIRVHLAEEGCPLIGDAVYGGKAMRSLTIIGRQALHAYLLGFEHPVTGELLRFEGDIPDDFRRAEERLRRGGGWR